MRESVVICDNPPDAPETVTVAVPVAGFSQLDNADRIWVAVNGFGR